jgi:threonine dehydratase
MEADTRSIVEPAGALALAGLKKYAAANPAPNQESTLCAILSGANMDFDRLRFVAERARLGEGKEVLLSVVVPDRPKVFNSMMKCILPRPVTEFAYRFGDKDMAMIFMSILVQDRDTEIPQILDCFKSKGFAGQDISDNELAKSHARYLAGGRLPDGLDIEERIYRFGMLTITNETAKLDVDHSRISRETGRIREIPRVAKPGVQHFVVPLPELRRG